MRATVRYKMMVADVTPGELPRAYIILHINAKLIKLVNYTGMTNWLYIIHYI